MKRINVKGPIISNDYKWIYDWFEMDHTAPNDVLNELPTDNSPIEVIVNSGGGDVYAGSEIYTALKDYSGDVTVKIVGVAASAASVIAMAGNKVLISPTAQIMIHNVQSGVQGDYRDLEHESEVIKNYNKSIANAYLIKSGKTQDEFLQMMDNETWLTAQQALEYNLVDEIMFQNEAPQLIASVQNTILPQNVIDKTRNMKNEIKNLKNEISNLKEKIANAETQNGNKNQNINNKIEEEKQRLLLELELI